MLHRGKRVFNIDPPTSPNAIMRRARPLPRREQWTRQVHHGELDTNPRVREQPQPSADIRGRIVRIRIALRSRPPRVTLKSGCNLRFGYLGARVIDYTTDDGLINALGWLRIQLSSHWNYVS